MKRSDEMIEGRCQYVKDYVKSSPSPVGEAITELSGILFLAESTIWNDYIK